MNSETKWMMVLNLLSGVGPKVAKKIIGAVGSAEEVFKIDLREVEKDGEKVGEAFIEAMKMGREKAIERVEKELEFIEKYNIEAVNCSESDYPYMLKQCEDAPLVIFKKGDLDLSDKKILSIVGTRNPSKYGEEICEEIVGELSGMYDDLVIVSGLAYGIDGCSHRAALKNGVKTLGVLAHGFHTIYPIQHRDLAKQMIEEGGALITEYISGTYPAATNFLARNRIIAGISNGTLIIESGYRGGSLSTAAHANGYSRDVMAIPGAPKAEKSQGCNALIKGHRARLVENATDVAKVLNWDIEKAIKSKPVQMKLLPTFNTEVEKKIYEMLLEHEDEYIMKNDIAEQTGIALPDVASATFMMEAENLIEVAGNSCRIRRR